MTEINLMNEISKLPKEIIQTIKEYIPKSVFAFTNRENYILYHKYIKDTNPDGNTFTHNNIIRNAIRRDYSFVLERNVRDNYKLWCNHGKYLYKNMIFYNYLYFIMYYCIENDSNNCRKIIYNFLEEHGLHKNLHKKNIVKYIRWKN
jgi:hypothetical protein